jgi:hypothetical protein
MLNGIHLSTFGKGEDFCGLRSGPVPKMLNSAGVGTLAMLSTFGHAGAAT